MWWALSYFVPLDAPGFVFAGAPGYPRLPPFRFVDVDMKKSPSKSPKLDPRSALRWSVAAATGLMLAGCPEDKPKTESDESAKPEAAHAAHDEKAGADKECCMGKNECKGKGGCAVPESNDCAGKNECKGKGGCNMHCPK